MEMVTSAVVQEAVSGAVSFMFSSRAENLMERLEMAHLKLDLALERTRMMPITIMPLLRLRKKLKDVFKECDDLLSKARDRHQVVPSLRRKIMHAVLPSFIVPSQDVLSSSVVGRFERFVKEADRFVRDVESGSSLSHYRFLSSPIRHLLEGKGLYYDMMQGSKDFSLGISTDSVEEYGRVAWLCFHYKDRKAPLKTCRLVVALRLYESTNIVGITAKCLRSLGPQFKSLVEDATGELSQLPTQYVSYFDSVMWERMVKLTTESIPDPFCCIANGQSKPCASNIISSDLVQGSKAFSLGIWTTFVEEYGRVALLNFDYKDRKAPLKNGELTLILRLYESTNIVGIAAKCLRSLGPQFKSLVEDATGELTQLPIQDVSYFDTVWSETMAKATTKWSPEPFCCIANGLNKPWAKNITSSEFTGRFAQEVMLVGFDCSFSASECCLQSSTDEARINDIKAWPPLQMQVVFAPHFPFQFPDGSSLQQKEEEIQTEAIDYFIRQPGLTDYRMHWASAHGCAGFSVSKPITKTRRASKRWL